LAISGSVLSLNLVGDGLRDALDAWLAQLVQNYSGDARTATF